MTPKKAEAKPEPTYSTFGDTLSVEVALLQAAAILDIAAIEAVRSNDLDRMQSIALSWMELGKLMFSGPPGDDDDDEYDDSGEEKKPLVVGFGNSERAEKVDE